MDNTSNQKIEDTYGPALKALIPAAQEFVEALKLVYIEAPTSELVEFWSGAVGWTMPLVKALEAKDPKNRIDQLRIQRSVEVEKKTKAKKKPWSKHSLVIDPTNPKTAKALADMRKHVNQELRNLRYDRHRAQKQSESHIPPKRRGNV